MNWTKRLDRAVVARKFESSDVIAAFSADTNLLATFGIPTDEWGIAFNGHAQRLSEAFGWYVLSDRVSDALRTFQAVAELADTTRGVLAA